MTARVVGTAFGVISPLGAGVDDFATALYSGARGFGPGEIVGGAATTGEIRGFDPKPWLGDSGIRVLDRTARLLCVAAHLALRDQQLPEAVEIGMVCGTMLGSVHSITSFDWSGLVDGPQYVSPLVFPNTVISSPAGQAAIRFKLRGVNSTICAGFASGLYALGYAAEFVRIGRARAALAGGAEELCEESFVGLRKAGAVSPTGSSRPFASNRDGTVPGEGAALFLVELDTSARERSAEARVEIAGFGSAHDARPSAGREIAAAAAQAAIERALERARVSAEEVGGIVSGANGSRVGDAVEARALAQVFGRRLPQIPVCAPKAALGEALGASGALCALAGALAVSRRCLPPTAGFVDTDSALRLSSDPQPLGGGDSVLITAGGCDGNHAALLLRRA